MKNLFARYINRKLNDVCKKVLYIWFRGRPWTAPLKFIFFLIQTRLYYFLNGRKHAFFGAYLQVQFHKNRLFFSCIYKKCFHGWYFNVIVAFHEELLLFRIDHRLHVPIDNIITVESDGIQYGFSRSMSSIHSC